MSDDDEDEVVHIQEDLVRGKNEKMRREYHLKWGR